MRIKSFFHLFLIVICLFSYAFAQAEKPNIVIFLADDLGYGSLNVYGAPEEFVKTPHLNKLAAEGILFKNAYATASLCTPTRYTLLTGEYSWRSTLKTGGVNNYDPLIISLETETIASYLQDRGYRTAAVGKWHLGYKKEKFENLIGGKIVPGPLQVGFDYHFGVPNNLDDLHKIYIKNDQIYKMRSNKVEEYGESYYGSPYTGYDAEQRVTEEVMDVTIDKAIEWIHQESNKPFFLYYGAVGVHTPIRPSKYMKGKSGAGVYGDFIQDVDRVAGRLLQALEEASCAKDTFFIFTSDNGGFMPGKKAKRFPHHDTIEMGFRYNGKLRGDKGKIFEGGLKVPFIIRWPQQLEEGLVSDALITTGDIFATLAEIVSGEVPDAELAAPDSFSFIKNLRNPSLESARPHMVNRDAFGRHAIRLGKWKYIEGIPEAGAGNDETRIIARQLYNIEEDPEEKNNLFDTHPEIAQKTHKLLVDIRTNQASRNILGP